MTRREWHGLMLGGLVAAPMMRLAGAPPGSTIGGVRIGAQSYSFRDRSLDDLIAAMREVGLTYCELWQDHVEPHQFEGAKTNEERREAMRTWRLSVPLDLFRGVREKFTSAGITLTAYNLSFRDDFTDAEIARGFEMARALGVPVITASSNVSTAPRIDPFARKYKIKVGFHNHSNIAPNEFSGPQDFETAMKGASRMIAINLDIGHFVAAGHDPVPFLDRHHDRIVSIHLKDRTKGDPNANLPFGEGDTPITTVLQRVRDRHWPIPANIEYEYKGGDTVAEVRKCFEYCRRALESRGDK
jgi:sugar phosphate isomerase/epimerase